MTAPRTHGEELEVLVGECHLARALEQVAPLDAHVLEARIDGVRRLGVAEAKRIAL